jgi:hypothetical protein
MEMSQENSLYNYLKQTKMSFFSFTKLESRRMEQVLSWGVGTSGGGCTYEKMRLVETIPGIREIRENDRGGKFNYDIFDIV